MFFKKKTQPEEHEYTVRGMDYRMKNVMKLAVPNPIYDSKEKIIKQGLMMSRVYQYTFVDRPVKLVPEKHNKADKNAVMVILAGEHVGYIPREHAEQVRKDIKRGISNLTAQIYGGRYKVVSGDGSDIALDDNIHIRVRYIA